MLQWAIQSTYYHIMIDRFATGKNRFTAVKSDQNKPGLQQWMGGNIRGITCSLDYLQQLGTGIILLTPFFKGKKYHGYWTTDFKNIDNHFGDDQQLKQLIDNAHLRNIRVMLDLPVTHCHKDAIYNKQAFNNHYSAYREWFNTDSDGLFQGFYGDDALPEFNLEVPEVRNYLKQITDHWLGYGFDGIRFDHAKRPSSAFWKNFTAHLNERHPQVFRLGENWPESGNIGTLTSYLHGELNIPLSKALRNFARQPGRQAIKHIFQQVTAQRGLRQQGYILPTFLDNHDMERVSQLAGNNQSIIALSYLIQFTLPYPPIIYYGSERAQTQSHNLPEGHYERDRHFREPMNWQEGEDMANRISHLSRLRNQYIAWFISEPVATGLLSENIYHYAYLQQNRLIVVIINFSPQQQQLDLPANTLQMLTSCNTTNQAVNANKINLQIAGYSGAIISNKVNDSMYTSNELAAVPPLYSISVDTFSGEKPA